MPKEEMIIPSKSESDVRNNINEGIIIPSNWRQQTGSIIKVIGVGGGGNNAVENMYNKGIEGVDFIICNTDEQVLLESPIPHKIQLGVQLTKGRGAGTDPGVGRQAAIENLDDIKNVLADNTEMVFITAGLGGGTGTGAAPVIAKEAKDMGILTVAIVTLPSKDEGDEPYSRALDGLQELRQHVDSLLIINNEKLYEIYPDLSVFDAFPKADDVVATAAKCIAELITKKGVINTDFADVKKVMKNSDMALMGLGKASGPNRALDAAEQALSSPLLIGNDISGAKNILINISSGLKNPLKVSELGQLMNYINTASGRGANVKRGLTKDVSLDAENSEYEIAVTIVATGFSMNNSFPVFDDLVEHNNPHSPEVVGLEDPVSDETIHVRMSPNTVELTPPVSTEITVKKVDVSVNTSPVNAPVNSVFGSQANVLLGRMPLKEADIADLEKNPAYLRKNIQIGLGESIVGEVSKHRLDESDGNHSLGENNSYLERDVD
jgi:cell division protein FtsZ